MNQLTLISVPASEGSQSPLNGRDSKPLVSLKSTHSQAESSRTAGQASQTGETFDPPLLFSATSLPPATHASRFPLQDEEKVRQMIVTSGRQCSTQLDGTSLIGAFLKMLLQSKEWFSPDALMTWEKEAISPRHSIFRLRLLDYRAWNGISGLLPRVEAHGWKGAPKRAFRGQPMTSATGGRIMHSLREVREDGIYPNPQFCEALKGFPISWSELPESETPSRRQSRSKS